MHASTVYYYYYKFLLFIYLFFCRLLCLIVQICLDFTLPSSVSTCSHPEPHQLDDSSFWRRDQGQNDPWLVSHGVQMRTLPDHT